jgi:hypothetical protein
MSAAPPRKYLSFWNILKTLLAFLLMTFVLSRTDLRQLPDLFAGISIHWVVLSLVLFLSLTLFKALQYYVLISKEVTYPQVLNVVILQNMVSNFLASGAGVVSYLTLLRVEHDVKVSRSMAMFLLTKIGDLIMLWLALLVTTPMVWAHVGTIRNVMTGLLVGIGLVPAFFLFSLIFRRKFVILVLSVLDWLGYSRIGLIRKGMDMLQAMSEIEHSRLLGKFAQVFFLSLLYFVFSLAFYYSNFMIFNFRMDIPTLVFVNVFIQLISYIPIQIFGGLGVAEISSLYLWSIFGIRQSALAPILIGMRILFYQFNLVPLIYLPLHPIFFKKTTDLVD